MSSTTSAIPVAAVKRPTIWNMLFPSVFSGIILGVIGAAASGILIHWVTSTVGGGFHNNGVPNDDAVAAAVFTGWVLFFFIGIGAFNGIFEWGFGRKEPTEARELYLAGLNHGRWRYFRWTTDHKVVGMQYLVTVFFLFFCGSMGAFMIRLEQSTPGAVFFSPATYNTIVGMHGILMIASTIIMVSGPFGNFILPIMIGARDMAFPRLNALSYWLLFSAIPVFLATLFLGGFPDRLDGLRASLAVQPLNPGMDSYSFLILIFATSTTVAAMNIVTTVMIMRTKGMTWGRLPVFVWGVLLSVILSLTAFPSFIVSQMMVLMDRIYNTSFFLAASGGSNWLYEHLFWFMGHPEVYVIALPSMAIAAELGAVFSRKSVYGYRLMISSMIGIAVLSVVVWGHHLYTSGSENALAGPYMLDTELISIPTGLFFLVLVGTLWRGRIWVTVPFLFVCGLLVNFVIGGITGIFLSDLPADEILHGGMFVTAHFHFTLVGAMVFGFMAGLYYWFPKMTGKRLNARLGALHFWLFEIGFVGTFTALFYAGLIGEPRWQANIAAPYVVANVVASSFAVLIAASVFVLAWNVIKSWWINGEKADANEWGAKTLEWATPTPVPLENFEGELPVVTSLPYTFGATPQALPETPAVEVDLTDVVIETPTAQQGEA